MGSVIAFRPRAVPPGEAEPAPSAAGDGDRRGTLIVFPGTDFSRVLPALGGGEPAAKPPRKRR